MIIVSFLKDLATVEYYSVTERGEESTALTKANGTSKAITNF